jgi:hypothetical protein
MTYNLVIYNPVGDGSPSVELLQVEPGHDLNGLNVVFSDPYPVEDTPWQKALRIRITSRGGRAL